MLAEVCHIVGLKKLKTVVVWLLLAKWFFDHKSIQNKMLSKALDPRINGASLSK